MLIINDCADFIAKTCSKYAFIHQNGRVLYNTFPDNVLVPIIKRSKIFFQKIPVLQYFQKSPMYVYRPTENVILIVSTTESAAEMEKLFQTFQTRYGLILAKKYSTDSLSLSEIFDLAIFSCARKMGPEPIAYVNKNKAIPEDRIYAISMASLMVLVGEYEGAKERILTFHPFIKDKRLGVIYLFQIPIQEARGNAFDAAILLMTDLANRAHCYNFHIVLERFMGLCADKLTEELQKQLKNVDVNDPVPDKAKFEDILKVLLKDLDAVLVESKSTEETQADMLEALNSLKETFKE
jgi:hypothetical protein